jgi:hypothetical protein
VASIRGLKVETWGTRTGGEDEVCARLPGPGFHIGSVGERCIPVTATLWGEIEVVPDRHEQVDATLLMSGAILGCAVYTWRGLCRELTLPHPAMAERRFVLEPLAEIAPEMADPVSGRTVAEMLARLAGQE